VAVHHAGDTETVGIHAPVAEQPLGATPVAPATGAAGAGFADGSGRAVLVRDASHAGADDGVADRRIGEPRTVLLEKAGPPTIP